MNLKETLREKYPYKIELHAHTSPASPCSQISPEFMSETYSKKGFDGVVITNHYSLDLFGDADKETAISRYIDDYRKTKEFGDKLGLRVYLGSEVRFSENQNDYLVYGVDREVLETIYDYLDKGLKEFRTEVKLPKSVFTQAHPNRNNMTKVDPALLDGMECYNMHPGHTSRNNITDKTVLENPHLISVGGSDFHNEGNDAIIALRVSKLPEDSFELAEILKSRDYVFEVANKSIILP